MLCKNENGESQKLVGLSLCVVCGVWRWAENFQNLYIHQVLLKCTPGPCLLLDFFVHFPNYLSLHYKTLLLVDDFFKIYVCIGSQIKIMYGYKLVRAARQSEKMQQVVQNESKEAV